MKNLLLASVSVIAVASAVPVLAADLPTKAPMMMAPAPAPFSWTGLYLGAHVGWGQTNYNTQGFASDGDPTSYNTGSATVSGGIFGGQLGYNWQFASAWVIGVEASISGSGMNGFQNTGDGFGAGCCQMWAKVDSLGSITGRLGWAGWDPRQMIYVKGGWAQVRDETLFSYATSTKHTTSGWTVGGGWEWAPVSTPNWSFFAEYDYYDFGTHNQSNCFGGSDSACSSVDVKRQISTVKVGANYRFNLGH